MQKKKLPVSLFDLQGVSVLSYTNKYIKRNSFTAISWVDT